jgi:cytochrome o ubiquinol oxidase subunit 2
LPAKKVFGLTFYIVYKYRASNKDAKYSPSFDKNPLIEITWWIIPTIIIAVLSVVTWNSSHQLDPFKPLVSNNKPVNVEVVALDWKWLFILPDNRMASVNQLDIPINTPVDFYITSDTVMNSFWVPQLGGQIYAMPGMGTELHLIANKYGSFNGSSANIAGDGFAGMTFKVNSVTNQQFQQWINNGLSSTRILSLANYQKLSNPSEYNPVTYYSNVYPDLYATIINKYMGSTNETSSSSSNSQTGNYEMSMQ